MKAKTSNGVTTYRGPSDIDGRPIMAILTGTNRPSQNRKTADMLQLWIMPTDSKPTEAIKNGDDVSVCGTCPHRPSLAKATGAKECYVNVGQAPNGIYGTSYPTADNLDGVRQAPVRLGAWGEPAAIPYEFNERLIGNRRHTGYTHRWREANPLYKNLLMASVDSPQEQAEASAKGFRTFRVRKDATVPVLPGEIVCPASEEGGRRTTCAQCLLCNGTTTKAKNIVIIEH
jgi:hypothetical protein